MKWQTISRVSKLGVTNFWRNRWLSLAATLVMTLTLLIISIFLILTLVINKTTDSIRSKMDISVYFNDTTSTDQIIEIQRELAARSDVTEVKYISKSEALENFKAQQQGKDIANLISPEENPLPRSLEVKALQPEDLDAIAQYAGQDQWKPIIHSISYQENKIVINRLIGFTNFIKKMGWIFSVVFVIISIMVILNTIRLTIFTRRDEIEIMRLVGASDTFIKVPFIIEGLIYAVLATIIATIIIKTGVVFIGPMMEHYLGLDLSSKMLGFFSSSFLGIIGLELLIGIIIGIGCSLFSIRKYVKT
jgi:cell division transport system permease protein